MLDTMRKHSRSFIIYVLFGIIIAVFVINFGPQSQGCTAVASQAGKVLGNSVSPKLLAYAFSVTGILTRQVPEPTLVELKARVVDQLVFRELLAEEALKLGFRVPEKEIDDMLVKGRFLALGQPRPLIQNDDGKFDYNLFSRYVRYNWGLTVRKFKDDQRRELLADKFRNVFRTSIGVAESEVRADFIQKNTKAELDYVRFAPGDLRNQVTVDDAKIKAYIAENKAKIKQYYDDNKTAYQKLPKQIRLQMIQVKGTDAAAKAKAEAALKRIKGGEDFAKVAAEASDDTESRARGGTVGWRNEDSPGLWETASKEAGKLKEGETSGVIEDKDGLSIVRVTGRRAGDLTMEQAQHEIAEEMAREAEALRLARTTAEGYLKRAQAGEKLADMFESPTTDSNENENEKKDEDKTDEDKDKDKKPEAEAQGKPKATFKLATTASFSRDARDLIPGIGMSPELMKVVFELKKGQVAPRVFTVDDNVYLVAVKDRTDPDWGEWTKRMNDLIEEFQGQKYVRELTTFAFERCEAAYKNKEIHFKPGILITPGYAPPKGDPPLPAYRPCSSLRPETL